MLLNDPQFVEAARVLAEQLLRRFPTRCAATRHARRSARLPAARRTRPKARILARLFAEQKDLFAQNLDDAARFLGVGDSALDETLPRADLAAMTAVVSAIMNLDEFVVVR